MSDEAHFHVIKYLNRGTSAFGVRKSICYAQATSSFKVTVLRSVTSSTVTRPHIFQNKQHETVTVNTDCYRGMFEKFLAPAM
jgi:hypothetical protein